MKIKSMFIFIKQPEWRSW